MIPSLSEQLIASFFRMDLNRPTDIKFFRLLSSFCIRSGHVPWLSRFHNAPIRGLIFHNWVMAIFVSTTILLTHLNHSIQSPNRGLTEVYADPRMTAMVNCHGRSAILSENVKMEWHFDRCLVERCSLQICMQPDAHRSFGAISPGIIGDQCHC